MRRVYPKYGDIRTKRKFILIPTTLPSTDIPTIMVYRWLEFALIEQRRESRTNSVSEYWWNERWLDLNADLTKPQELKANGSGGQG